MCDFVKISGRSCQKINPNAKLTIIITNATNIQIKLLVNVDDIQQLKGKKGKTKIKREKLGLTIYPISFASKSNIRSVKETVGHRLALEDEDCEKEMNESNKEG